MTHLLFSDRITFLSFAEFSNPTIFTVSRLINFKVSQYSVLQQLKSI